MIKIIDVLKTKPEGQKVSVQGWIKTFRGNRFIALNDGSTINNLQCVIDYENLNQITLKGITTGTSIKLEIRGKKYGGKVSELPFYKKSYVK